MTAPPKTTIDIRSYILAALIPLAAFLLQWLLWETFQPFVWFLFYPAVFFSAWIGGKKAGVVATIFSALAVWWFFMPYRYSFTLERPASLISIGVFVGMGVLFSFIHDRLRKANQSVLDSLLAVKVANDQLEERVNERTAELEQTVTALLKSEQEFRSLAEAMPQIVWITRPDGWNIYFNQQWITYTGMTLEESCGNGWNKPFHPDDQQRAWDAWQNATTKIATYSIECRLRRADGIYRWWLIRGVPVRDTDGKIIKWFGTCTDIEELKQIEEVQSYLLQINSLDTGEDFFESLARYLANILGMDYVCIDTLHGDGLTARTLAVYHDGRFEDNVEYALKDTPCGDVAGKEICVFNREVRKLFPQDAALQDLQAECYVGTTLWSYDMKPIGLIAVIGRKELNNSHFAESVLKLVSVRAANELERRQAEAERHALDQQYQQTQKLESLGVLAGGIAHDFNNLLAIIMGYCSLTKMDYETAENNIPEIEKAVERAAALCRQMLVYAGKAPFEKTQVDICMTVTEMLKMLQSTIAKNVVIKPELSVDVPCVIGDASQIRQVVMNLIINAAEAIGDAQGEVRVSLSQKVLNKDAAEKDYLGKIIPHGFYVCLEVADTGGGMSYETYNRIFEPFYTTKFSGRGLGMSAVLGIIQTHSGALQLSSELGKGTTFKIFLPAQNKDCIGENSLQQVSSTTWQGNGTILLVEDEVQVLLIARTMLQRLGFTVIEASNGKEALELYQKNAADIKLVITDMGMPVMDGYRLHSELKTLRADLPIIISSGFGDTVVKTRIANEDIAGSISKPYSFDRLRDVLKGVLDEMQKHA